MRGSLRSLLLVAVAALVFAPGEAFAQTGNISGVARDSSGGALPGVTVVVTSPALIEKQRTTVTDGAGRYQITALPVGTYKVTFTLENFSPVERGNVELSTDFTANVNADMKLGGRTETVTVVGQTNLVDVQNARQRQVFTGEALRDLPIPRDLTGLVNLVPGISTSAAGNAFGSAGHVQQVCVGGAGGFADNPDAFGGGAFGFTTTGALSGCNPIIGGFNAHSDMSDAFSLNQGRIQVDGLGVQSFGGGGRTSYMPDVAGAQEVTFTLSGSMGESETGGTTINIIPRTGGNRYSGNFFTAYSDARFWDRNNGTRRSTFLSLSDYDYDVSASYGGPILRDRLWFYTAPRQRSRKSTLTDAFPNANVGAFGANYVSDTTKDNLGSTEVYKNISLRLTLQASERNKFNIFWDEQYTCENPCEGVSTAWMSEEAEGTRVAQPLHLAQLSWTNPLTNKILLEAGGSWYSSHTDWTRNRFVPTYPGIPKITETGDTIQQANPIYRGGFNFVTSGSINNNFYQNTDNIQTRASFGYVTGNHNAKIGYQGGFLQTFSQPRYNDMRMEYAYASPVVQTFCSSSASATTRTACANAVAPGGNAAASGAQIVTDTTGAQTILNGCYYSPAVAGSPGAAFATPPTQTTNGTTYTARPWCGSINIAGNPNNFNDPINSRFLPIPTSVTLFVPSDRKERAWFSSFYVQDQWTLNRVTLNGALRYDNSKSAFLETCIGPDTFIPNPAEAFCMNTPGSEVNGSGEGVSFQDITPRFGAAWDVFGNGRTSLKFNGGKYVGGTQVGGIYTASNVAGAGRFQSSFIRQWNDLDGDRVVDGCDLLVPEVAPPSTTVPIPGSGECGAIPTTGSQTANSVTTYRRWARSPNDTDASGATTGLGNIQCGRKESTLIPPAATPYCDAYYADGGGSLLNGWDRRRYEWQFGVGIQHEILPRLSAEVTYNRRSSHNITIADDVGVGCDLYGPTANNPDDCMARQLNFESEWYDFYGVRAPLNPLLPNGGGYLIPGFADRKPGVVIPSANAVTVETLDKDGRIKEYWRGVDVNVTMRAKGGLRLTGGTSTGAQYVNNCNALVDQADITGVGGGTGVVLMEGKERSCSPSRPFQTNVRGTATYTIPWVDVLVSTVFAYRPGAFVRANMTVPINTLEWAEGSEYRATYGGPGVPAGPGNECPAVQGCLLSSANAQTVNRNLISNDITGEGSRMFDIKLAKNIRFGSRRLNLGMDIYNAFNSDAAVGYCESIPACGDGSPYMRVFNLNAPRYARFQVQFDF